MISFALLTVFLFCVFGCSHSSNKKNDNAKNIHHINSEGSETDQEHKRGDTGWSYVAGFSPLTYEKYHNIRTNDDSFSYAHIFYGKLDNFDAYGDPLYRTRLNINAGFAGKSFIMNSFDEYQSGFFKDIEDVTPPNGEYLYSMFTSAQVEAIFSYIESEENRLYFFNGEEYQGKSTPFDSENLSLVEANCTFSLIFFYPDEKYYAWAIHKGEDEPCDILQGLIDILEDDFISQF